MMAEGDLSESIFSYSAILLTKKPRFLQADSLCLCSCKNINFTFTIMTLFQNLFTKLLGKIRMNR